MNIDTKLNFDQCQYECLKDPECIAVDMGSLEDAKYRCQTYSGDGYNFKVGCNQKEDVQNRKCYKRKSSSDRSQGKRKLGQKTTRKFLMLTLVSNIVKKHLVSNVD